MQPWLGDERLGAVVVFGTPYPSALVGPAGGLEVDLAPRVIDECLESEAVGTMAFECGDNIVGRSKDE